MVRGGEKQGIKRFWGVYEEKLVYPKVSRFLDLGEA